MISETYNSLFQAFRLQGQRAQGVWLRATLLYLLHEAERLEHVNMIRIIYRVSSVSGSLKLPPPPPLHSEINKPFNKLRKRYSLRVSLKTSLKDNNI